MTLNTGQSSVYDVDTEVSLLTPTHFNGLFNRDESVSVGYCLMWMHKKRDQSKFLSDQFFTLICILEQTVWRIEGRSVMYEVLIRPSDWVKFASDGDKRTEELSDEYVRE